MSARLQGEEIGQPRERWLSNSQMISPLVIPSEVEGSPIVSRNTEQLLTQQPRRQIPQRRQTPE